MLLHVHGLRHKGHTVTFLSGTFLVVQPVCKQTIFTGPERGNRKGVTRKAAEKLPKKVNLGGPWHEKLPKKVNLGGYPFPVTPFGASDLHLYYLYCIFGSSQMGV